MGFESSATAVGKGAKGVGVFFSPLGRWNLYIALFFFLILIFVGVSQSVEEKSLYPLWHQTGERLVSADVHIGQLVDKVTYGDVPVKPSSFFSNAMPVYYWFWIKWIFEVLSCAYMMYFFGWLLYAFFSGFNNSLMFKNILSALVLWLIIGSIMGMVLFNMSLAGKTLPDDRQALFNAQISESYPFHGTVKFVKYVFNGENINRVYSWMNTDVGSAISGIEQINNESVSGVNVSG